VARVTVDGEPAVDGGDPVSDARPNHSTAAAVIARADHPNRGESACPVGVS
jgi:hypothetical protein